MTEIVIDASLFGGFTADVRITNAIAALPSIGGIVDVRSLVGSQTIAVTVPLGRADGAPVQILFNPATRFTPASANTNMFLLYPSCQVSGLTSDVTGVPGYTGTVMTLNAASAGIPYDNQPGNWPSSNAQTRIDNATFFGGGNTTGTAILLQASSANEYIEFCSFEHIGITGFRYGVYMSVLGNDAWINANHFADIRISNTVYSLVMDTAASTGGASCTSNTFYDLQCEYSTNLAPVGVYFVLLKGGGCTCNIFTGIGCWDMPAGDGRRHLRIDTKSSTGNVFLGQIEPSMVTDASGTAFIGTCMHSFTAIDELRQKCESLERRIFEMVDGTKNT